MTDFVSIWTINVLLQVTVVSALGLLIAVCCYRNSAAKYWVLCSGLVLMLISPLLVVMTHGSPYGLVLVERSHIERPLTELVPDPADHHRTEEQRGFENLPPRDAAGRRESYPGSHPARSGSKPSAVDERSSWSEFADRVTAERSANSRPYELPTKASSDVGAAVAADSTFNRSTEMSGFQLTLRASVFLLLCVWLGGAAIMLSRLAISWLRLSRILRTARHCPDETLEHSFKQICCELNLRRKAELAISDKISGPISAGLFRPRVILPPHLTEHISKAQLRNILVHEVAHIVRYDPVIVLLQNLVGALYWLHPLVKCHNRALGQAREEICDNYVLATTDAPSYARTLLALAELVQSPRSIPGAVGLFTSGWKLEERVADLLDDRRSRLVELTRRTKILAALASSVMTVVATMATVTVVNGQEATEQIDGRESDANLNLVLAPDSPDLQHRTAPELRGEGGSREMLLRGRVLGISGKPALDCDIFINVKRKFERQLLPVTLNGSHFEVWVPVGSSDWFYLEIQATAKDGKSRVVKGLGLRQLRQAAIEGIDLQLATADRKIEISVIQNNSVVANAHVAVELRGSLRLHGETNNDGKVAFQIMAEDKLRQITAWTDDLRLGGYMLNRKPYRDPLANEYVVDLEDCRPQKIRLVHAKDGSPIPDVRFQFIMSTAPHYNFPALPDTFPYTIMKTNDQGEATCRWFPDWEKHNSYVNIIDPRWAKAEEEMYSADDGALAMKLKPRVRRRPLVGQLESDRHNVGGLLVTMKTFQAEEEGRSDHVYTFTDQAGRFSADCIPGSTYYVYVDDAEVTSNIIDLIPYKPESGKSNMARLEVSIGEPVEVQLTSGPNHRPIRNESVHFRTVHDFTWTENGTERNGSGGRSWQVRTDENGIARSRALAGTEFVAQVYADEWRSGKKSVTVQETGVTTLKFHRKLDVEREIKGILTAPAGVDVANAEVIFGSIDGETDERDSTTADKAGRFTFKTKAIRFGVFAYTADGTASGFARVGDLDGTAKIQLKPTCDLHGQLRGKNNTPLTHHRVSVDARVRGKRDWSKSFSSRFTAKTFETKTDSVGNYTLKNLPSELDMTLRAAPIDDSKYDAYLDDFFLVPGDGRPRMVSRLDRTNRPAPPRTLAEKYARTLRDAALGNFHLMLLVYESSSKEFVKENLLDDDKIEEISSFMDLQIRAADLSEEKAKEFALTNNWPSPVRGKVFVLIQNGTGKPLGRLELAPSQPEAEKQVAAFVRRHAPPQADARKKWNAAFAEAKRSGRKVWARVSQRYCGPCFRINRWLDDNRELLERDYVLLKIDNVRDKHGADLAKLIVSDREHFGVPFHAIFDANENLVIDSESPAGNIGHPSSFEGRFHLTKMLSETRTYLSDAQVKQVVATLDE